jgi:hypothetical protein
MRGMKIAAISRPIVRPTHVVLLKAVIVKTSGRLVRMSMRAQIGIPMASDKKINTTRRSGPKIAAYTSAEYTRTTKLR